MYRLTFFFIASFFVKTPGVSQITNPETIAARVQLDSVVVTALKGGLEIVDFIRLMQEDQSFSEAFQNLRKVSYRAENSMSFFNARDAFQAGYQSSTIQTYAHSCRTMKILQEGHRGDFYRKNGDYRYTTAKMFDRVFFTHGEECDSTGSAISEEKGLEKYYQELKKFIFQAGEKVDVPFIGSKTAIFSPKLLPYYDFFLQAGKSNSGTDCYIFSIRIKPEYEEKKENKTIIKYLETYFERPSLKVLERRYGMQYAGPAFRFNVNMQVEIQKIRNLYLPARLEYAGSWDIPLHKEEKGQFTAAFYEFFQNP